MDDEPAQAVADEVHLGDLQLRDEGREALGRALHAGERGRVAERVQREIELLGQATPEHQRLVPRHPQPVYVHDRGHDSDPAALKLRRSV